MPYCLEAKISVEVQGEADERDVWIQQCKECEQMTQGRRRQEEL